MNQEQFYAIRTARALLAQKPLYLDTETTGLSNFDEIIDLALIDSDGTELINTLIRPTIPIHAKATEVHHISNEDIIDAPGFNEIMINLVKLTEDRLVLIYNTDFDQRMLRQSAAAYKLKKPCVFCKVHCAMKLHTQFYGRKTTLGEAAFNFGLIGCDLHRASVDAQLCRQIVEAMAATSLPGEEQ